MGYYYDIKESKVDARRAETGDPLAATGYYRVDEVENLSGYTVQYEIDVRYLNVVGNVAAFAGPIVAHGTENDFPYLVLGDWVYWIVTDIGKGEHGNIADILNATVRPPSPTTESVMRSRVERLWNGQLGVAPPPPPEAPEGLYKGDWKVD